MSVSKEVTRDVAFRSGNKCAFPNCEEPIYDMVDGVYVGELAHIEAENEKGLRYNPNQTDKERNGAENLMFMCPNHHNRIDKKKFLKTYTVKKLKEMKKAHEVSVETLEKKIVNKIVKGAQEYLRENSTEIDMNQSGGFKKWLESEQYVQKDIEDVLSNIELCIQQMEEMKEDTQSFIYNFLVHGKKKGSPLDIIFERSEIEDNRMYSIVKLLQEEEIIDDIKAYDLEEQVLSYNEDLVYQVQHGVWKLGRQFSNLYILKDFLESQYKNKKIRECLKQILFERDITSLE